MLIRSTRPLVVALGFGFLAVLALALAHSQSTPAGVWKTIDDDDKEQTSLIRISELGGLLTGRFEKLLKPGPKTDAVCDQCTDDRKDKPIVGKMLISGVRQSESDKTRRVGGERLDSNNGKTYKARLTLGEAGKTRKARDYIGTPMLGRTHTWVCAEQTTPLGVLGVFH